MKKIFKDLVKSHDKYEGAKGGMESYLQEHADFQLSVEYQPSDGFVVVDEYAGNAPLDLCLKLIEDKGSLSHSDYLRIKI
jgi:hypothetical protein